MDTYFLALLLEKNVPKYHINQIRVFSVLNSRAHNMIDLKDKYQILCIVYLFPAYKN